MAKVKILKTSETDIDSTDIWRFAVHSDYPTQKIDFSGTTSITIPTGSDNGSTTINHSLGYAPVVYAMFEVYGSRYVKILGNIKTFRPDDNEPSLYMIVSSTTQIKFRCDAIISTLPAESDITINIYYIALNEDV